MSKIGEDLLNKKIGNLYVLSYFYEHIYNQRRLCVFIKCDCGTLLASTAESFQKRKHKNCGCNTDMKQFLIPTREATYKYKGSSYTLSQLQDETGIKLDVLDYRFNKLKLSVEEALKTPKIVKFEKNPTTGVLWVFYEDGTNEEFLDIHQRNKKSSHPISYDLLYSKIRTQGWSVDEVLSIDLSNHRPNKRIIKNEEKKILNDIRTGARKYEYKDKQYTLSELCDLSGIPLKTLYSRLHRSNLSVTESIEGYNTSKSVTKNNDSNKKVVKVKKNKVTGKLLVIYGDGTSENFLEVYNRVLKSKNPQDYVVLYGRMIQNGWTEEKAINTPIKKCPKKNRDLRV